MGADELGGGYGGGVVLAYGDPKLLLLTLGHQPGLMDSFGRYILQLWDPSLHILSLQVIVLQPDTKSDRSSPSKSSYCCQKPNQMELYIIVVLSGFCRPGTWLKVCAGIAVWPVLA